MTSRIERFLIALMFALLAAGVTLIAASAQDDTSVPTSTSTQGFTQDCTACHTDFQMSWDSGAHGNSGSDPVFLEQWTEQGKPGACLVCHTTGYDPATATYKTDGVTCEACHGPASSDHPKSPMPVDRSPDLCGRCHSDTRFGWQDWKVSTHYQRGMDCATCHDPHSASLKKIAVEGSETPADDVSALCINCHQEHSMDFPYTSHNQKGVSCVDCHLNHLEEADREPHTVPDHSFQASLDSCNTCHAEQMHAGETEAVVGTSAPLTVSTTGTENASATPEPEPVSPLGFSALAGLLGLAGGMVLAPWLERWYRRTLNQDQEDDNG